MSFCLPVPSAIRLPWRVGHEFGPTGVDSDGVCATSVPILRTSPSRVTWFVVGVAWRATEVCQAADWRNHQQECYKHQLAQLDDEIDREWERQGV